MAFVDTQTTTAAEFCLFFLSCRHETQNRRYFRDMHVENASLLAIHNNTMPKTNGTDAGRPSLWRHLDGMQKPDYIPIEPTFSRWLDEPEYRLAWAVVRRTFRSDHSTVHYHRHSTPHTIYHIPYITSHQTSCHPNRTIRNEDCRIQTSTTTFVSQL